MPTQRLIEETSERGADGIWRYRDLRMRAESPMRSCVRSSRECAHRSRPLRYDGRVVVTLCSDEVLYLPVTTEITRAARSSRAARLPLALARRAAEHARMARVATDLPGTLAWQ